MKSDRSRRLRRNAVAVLVGFILTLASGFLANRQHVTAYPDIMGCEAGCPVATAGWPLPYVYDYPGISVAGSADLLGALAGEDRFHILPFALDLVVFMLIGRLVTRPRRRQPPAQ